ncbi:MAG: LysR family transcriptional regulator [Actinobacteria bacterium HGW-Actinobacteria-9]|jgi:enamine deaminase RidA (YjgF/YER057c/UK114 family)|nr:MAG: LysR family transcriptional regulator [Actinobacteria bacterium HGW-Actinobacteria-9]
MTTAHEKVVARLAKAGLVFPAPAVPVGDYVPATRSGNLVFTSGQLPLRDGALYRTGTVGSDVTVDDAVECARIAALNALAAASTVCDLDDVSRVLKLIGYVASASTFVSQPAVVNGASGVLVAAFGEAGVHAREAVGVSSLPMGAPVEVSIVLEMR